MKLLQMIVCVALALTLSTLSAAYTDVNAEHTTPEVLEQAIPDKPLQHPEDDYPEPSLKLPIKKPTTTPATPVVTIDKNTDVLFIGNSLTEGMRIVTEGYTNNQFICKSGVSLDGLQLSPMYNMEFKAVIINMGTNEIGGYSKARFISSYQTLIEKIQEYNPDARIICCSVPPIAETTNYAAHYNNANAKLYTTYILEAIQGYDVQYLDNALFFGSELNPNWTGDGLHYRYNIYTQWYEFLLSHI